MPTLTKAQKLEQSEARDYLRSICPAGTTLSTELLYVSRSGMMRIIAVQHPTEGDITREASTALGDNLRDVPHSATANYGRRGIRVDGCGMDMGFHLVYSLSATLHGHADRGGYALSQRWAR